MSKPDYARPLGRPPGVNLATCCCRGHEYTPENTYYDSGDPSRQCRTCRNQRNAAWQQAHREKMRPYHREWMRRHRLLMYLARDLGPYGREVSEMSPVMDLLLRGIAA